LRLVLQTLHRHRRRRTQFLREQADAQFFQQPAELLDLRIDCALLGQQDGAALVVGPQRRVLGHQARIARRVGLELVEAHAMALR
jgi:hypothetical protein